MIAVKYDKTLQIKIRIAIILILILAICLTLQILVNNCIAINDFCKKTTQIRSDFLQGSILVLVALPICLWRLFIQYHIDSIILTIPQAFENLSRVALLLWATFQIVMGIAYTIVNPHNSFALIALYFVTTIGWSLILIYFSLLQVNINKSGIWNKFY